MAREFDPNNPNRIDRPVGEPMNDPLVKPRSGMGSLGMLAAAAIAIVLGLVFWNMADRSNTTATNTAPGVTTGSSTTPATPPRTDSPTAPASR
jgi:hypothetical protein